MANARNSAKAVAATAAAKAASIPERQEEPPPVDVPGMVTPEEALKQIREGLKQVAMRDGTDAAREMLKVHAGGAENVSGIDPKFYAPLLNALGV